MTSYAGSVPDTGAAAFLGDQLEGGVGRLTLARPPHPDSQYAAVQPEYRVPSSVAWTDPIGGAWFSVTKSTHSHRKFGAGANQILPVSQDDFFEQIIIIPRSINVGVVLGTIVEQIDVYNAYKREQRTLTNWVNNAGAGIIATNLPALPATIEEQDGFLLTINVLVDGPPFISGTLDFVFDTETIQVAIVGQRAVVFAYEPVEPIQETLQFLTDVIEKRNGEEQRIALRAVPRQVIDQSHIVEGRERRRIENTIFSNQGRVYGVPIWWEQTRTTAAIAASDITVQVQETDYRDFRAGSFAMVWRSAFDFEVLQVLSFTPTSITFTDGFVNTFDAGAAVMPVRTGYMQRRIGGSRWPVNLQSLDIEFQIVDSTEDLADVAAFPTYDGKVLLDEANMIVGGRAAKEAMNNKLHVIDSLTGTIAIFAENPYSRRTHPKGFFSNSMQRLWEVRGLIHALRGKQTSFYIPTFFEDFTPVGAINNAGTTMDVENVGYNRFVDAQQPRNVVHVRKTDGTRVTRLITGSNEISDEVEQISVTPAWGIDATVDEIELVTIVEKGRSDSDDIQFTHFAQPGRSDIRMPVIGVFD